MSGMHRFQEYNAATRLRWRDGTNDYPFGRFGTTRLIRCGVSMDFGLVTVLDNPFLRDLTPEQYDLLAALFEPIEFPPEAAIFQQGEHAVYMYLLLGGDIRLQYKPYDGPIITLTQLHQGAILGWSAVIGNENYTSNAVAISNVRLLRARGDTLRRLCVEYPAAGRSILEKLAKAVSPRWVDAQEQIQRVLEAEVFPKS